MGATETIQSGGKDMAIYIAKPEGAGPFPAMLVMHHGAGLDDFTRDRCDKLVEAGFAAAAPDLYHRFDPSLDATTKRESLKDAELETDIRAGLARLQAEVGVDAKRLGVVGHCMGGRFTLMAAGRLPDQFACAVPFYPGNTKKQWGENGGPAPFDTLGHIKCPVLGFFGAEDANPSPADRDDMDAAMSKAGVAHEFHTYEGAGHAFQNFVEPARYRKEASDDAQAKMLAFLDKTLK